MAGAKATRPGQNDASVQVEAGKGLGSATRGSLMAGTVSALPAALGLCGSIACPAFAISVQTHGKLTRGRSSNLQGVRKQRLQGQRQQEQLTGAGLAAPLATVAGLAAARLGRQSTDRCKRAGIVAAVPAATTAQTPTSTKEVDVVIIGAGPAGTLLSYLLAERHDCSVCLVDPRASQPWPNNYGVWQEEWDALEAKLQVGLSECLDTQWPVTDCYFGGSWDMPTEQRLRLDRPYARVDRAKLRARLRSSRVQIVEDTVDAEALATNVYSGGKIQHDDTGTLLRLASGDSLHAKLVVDCTGSESRLTRRLPGVGEPPAPDPGYQIAYGMECIVDGHMHYDAGAMTLFDYRTDHLAFDPKWEERAQQSPTFMYVMPLGPVEGGKAQRIFFEETSLVARPAVSFEECKKRCLARLKHLGVSFRPDSVTDEEYCYIPMGGALPEPGQRIAAFGGAAVTVHPATGYQICRMMAGAKEIADAIGAGLADPAGYRPDAVAAAAYQALWSPENQAQRDFSVFGGEFLMTLDVAGLRGWFNSFFALPEPLWAGFLAGWPTLPGNENHESWSSRISFGLQMFVKLPPAVALRLVTGIAKFTAEYGVGLFRSVTPLFGSPPTYAWSPPAPPDQLGDVEAKNEARAMIAASRAKQH